MIRNLFSIFDTNTNTVFELNWLSSFFNLLILPYSFWLFNSKFYLFIIKFNFILYKEIKIILFNKFNFFNTIYLTSLFFFILINNLIGLFPYIFTRSSHIIFSIRISLPLWFRLFFFRWFKNTNFIFSHIIPQRTPYILIPFIVLIETIRNIIRPRTLTIRLTANIIAGHLLLTLLRQIVNNEITIIIIIIIQFTQIILLILEFSVSIIQSYVFSILTTLYIKETN